MQVIPLQFVATLTNSVLSCESTISSPTTYTYNTDEKGFQLGVHNRAKVIVRHRRRPLIEKMDGSREWITVVESNSMLPPMVIYKGRFTEVDQNVKFAHSAKGYYMADKLANEWLQAFDIATKEHAQGDTSPLDWSTLRFRYFLVMV